MADNFNNTIGRTDLGASLIPDEVSQEIIQTVPESSVLLTRAKRMRMSSKKKTQPVLASLPEAYWVQEGALKQTTKTGWEDVNITAEEMAVIVPIPDSVVDDAKINLWDTIKPLIAEAFGKKIDEAGIFGVDKPATWGLDILAGAAAAGTNIAQGTGVDLAQDVAKLGENLSKKGYAVNGFASQPGLNWQLVGLRDANGQPVYTPSLTQGAPSNLYGYPLNEVKNGAWDATKAVLLAADWSKFVVGIRQDMTYQLFDQGVISNADGKVSLQPHAAGRQGSARGHARRLPGRQPDYPSRGKGHPVSGGLHHPEGEQVMAKQIRFISQPAIIDGQDVAEVAAFDATGHPLTVGSAPAAGSVTNGMLAGGITKDKLAEGVIPPAYSLPAASANALGGVKKAATVAAVASADANPAAGEAPTKAEFDAVVTELNETKKQLNAALVSLKAAGIIA